MDGALSPLVLGALAIVLLGAVIVTVGARRQTHKTSAARLPHGADAALWSIVEAMPDPRNHLALTRDLSGEVHITDLDRATALAQAMDVVVAERAPVQVVDLTDSAPAPDPLPVRTSAVSAEGLTNADRDDNLTVLSRRFFSEPPRLNRF